MIVVTSFLVLAALLALPATVAAQTTQPPVSAGWYRNSGPAIIHDDPDLKIVWGNSYIYPYPGQSPLYWFAEVDYLYKGTKTFNIHCAGVGDFTPVREHMRNTPNSGYVDAAETFCSRNRTYTVTLKGGEHFRDWVIFHNVPWPGGEVLLEWPAYDSWQQAQWVDPWHSRFSAPPPAECPPELETLGTCQPRTDTCDAVSNIGQTLEGIGADSGLVEPTFQNIRLDTDTLKGEVELNNYMSTWLELVNVHFPDSTSDFSANTNAVGLAGIAAVRGLIPPCPTDITHFPTVCTTPGKSAWIASFCTKGDMIIDMGQSPRAAMLTMLSAVASLNGLPLDKLYGLANQLLTVPSLDEAAKCFSPPTDISISCASNALSQLAIDLEQLKTVQAIFRKFGVNLAAEALVNLMTGGVGIGLLRNFADEVTYINRTVEVGTYPFVRMGIYGE